MTQGHYTCICKINDKWFLFNDDKYFQSFWINNRQHGEGMFYLNGKILKGIFRYGKMIMKID